MSATVFPRDLVHEVFRELFGILDPDPAPGHPNALAELVCAVGGFRRRKREMKDLELLYIPNPEDRK